MTLFSMARHSPTTVLSHGYTIFVDRKASNQEGFYPLAPFVLMKTKGIPAF